MDSLNRRSRRRFFIGALGGIAALILAAAGTWSWQTDAQVPGDSTDLDQVAFGSRVYRNICANCHGTQLDGQLGWREPLKDGTRLAPAHSTKGETWKLTDDDMFEVVKFGGEALKPAGERSRMPGFETKLTDLEIWAVIAFIKSTWPIDVQQAQQEASVD